MRNVVSPIPNAATVPEHPAFRQSSRTFLSLARNHPVKGHRQLFEAFSLVATGAPDWNLVAYGTNVTMDDEAMRRAITEAGAEELTSQGRIRLLGATDHPEEALAAASALVISSVYGEAFPIVGAEAAGLGIPVISTDLGSCQEFVDDPQFLVRPGDASALAAALRSYISLDDDTRAELSQAARSRAEQEYHPRTAYERYRSLFAQLIEQRQQEPA
nr:MULTISPECIES: glycosyltransferase [unclassified Leucobacter]